MKFNFGAMLGGAAKQIVEDVTERENEVKLRTRTILDRHVAETAANRKEYKAKKEKVEQQIKQVAAYFGDDPYALNKARDIVAGGDSHVTNMLSKFELHTKNKGDVNELYKYTPNKDEVGFKGVEDATDSIVKLATVATPDFGALEQTSGLLGLFGKTDPMKAYKEGRKQYEASGLLEPIKDIQEAAKSNLGSGAIDLSKLAQDAPTLEIRRGRIFDERAKIEDKESPEYLRLTEELDKVKTEILSTNSAYIAATAKGTSGKTDTELQKSYDTGLKTLLSTNTDPNTKMLVGADGQIITTPEDNVKRQKQLKADYDKNFVKRMVDGNGDFLDSDGQRWAQSAGLTQYLGGDDDKKDDISKTPVSQEDKDNQIKEKYPNPEEYAEGMVNNNKSYDKAFKRLQDLYGIDADTAQKILREAIKNKPKEKDYGKFVDPTKPAPKKRPEKSFGSSINPFDDEESVEKAQAEWDKLYGDTHNPDGSVKK